MNSQKIVVIGGGVAGLTAATILARAGKSVTLSEKSSHTGGRAITEIKNGFHFNLGPHALYAAGHGVRILRELGIQFHGAIPSSSGALAIFKGRKHTMPNGAVSLMSTSLFGLAAKMEAGKLLNNIGKIDAKSVEHLTVNEWVQQEIRQPEVCALVRALFRVATYASDAERHSAGAALAQLQMAISSGVYYLDGGWQTIMNGLRAAAQDAGAEIFSGVKAEKVSSAQVTFDDGSVIENAAVIIAASPSDVSALLALEKSNPLAKKIGTAIPIKAACLDIALESLPQPRSTFALGLDSPLYFSVHSATATLAPSGGAMIHVAKYLGTNEKTKAQELEQELTAMLDLLQLGWQKAVVAKRFLPSMTVSHALVTASDGGYEGRPKVAVPEMPGVFLAGDWIGNEGMLADASFASAERAALAVLEFLG